MQDLPRRGQLTGHALCCPRVKPNLFGLAPDGYLYYGANSRMYTILVAQAQKAPADLVPTDSERIELSNGLFLRGKL